MNKRFTNPDDICQVGVKMTKQIKKIGCANIKTLIESDKVFINDFNIIEL